MIQDIVKEILEEQALSEGLSSKDKRDILKDFEKWSGGYHPGTVPWEDEDGDPGVMTYIKTALDKKYKEKDVEDFLKGLR